MGLRSDIIMIDHRYFTLGPSIIPNGWVTKRRKRTYENLSMSGQIICSFYTDVHLIPSEHETHLKRFQLRIKTFQHH